MCVHLPLPGQNSYSVVHLFDILNYIFLCVEIKFPFRKCKASYKGHMRNRVSVYLISFRIAMETPLAKEN